MWVQSSSSSAFSENITKQEKEQKTRDRETKHEAKSKTQMKLVVMKMYSGFPESRFKCRLDFPTNANDDFEKQQTHNSYQMTISNSRKGRRHGLGSLPFHSAGMFIIMAFGGIEQSKDRAAHHTHLHVKARKAS